MLAIGAARLTRRRRIYTAGAGVAAFDLVTQLLLVVLGVALLWSPDALTKGVSLGTSPSWHQIVFAFPLAMLAYTGLETVANLAEETRRPGVQLPKSLFAGIGAVVAVYVAIAFVGLMAFPVRDGATELGTTWAGAPLMGIVAALDPHLPEWLHVPLRVLRRHLRRVHPAARGGVLALRLRAARVLARRARPAAARLRTPAPAHARLAAGRARGGRDLGGDHHRRLAARNAATRSSRASSASASCSRSPPRSSP